MNVKGVYDEIKSTICKDTNPFTLYDTISNTLSMPKRIRVDTDVSVFPICIRYTYNSHMVVCVYIKESSTMTYFNPDNHHSREDYFVADKMQTAISKILCKPVRTVMETGPNTEFDCVSLCLKKIISILKQNGF